MKSKSAAFPQRFIIAGATSGNGTYAGQASTPPVLVDGDAWTITIQSNPGTSFVDSADRIKFPAISAGQYRFDIESDDPAGDEDFNDLILTCSTPVTATDFIIYGNVTCYSGFCVFNPCIRRWVVIESAAALLEAVRIPVFREPLEKLYPERVLPRIPPPPPEPDPPLFVPMVIPLQDETALPAKRVQVVSRTQAPVEAKARKTAAGQEEPAGMAFRSVAVSRPSSLAFDIDRVSVGKFVDRFRLSCETEALGGFVIRFQEYDRTAAELAGGAYAGTGMRENLGLAATDRNGNYIFRFSRSIAQFLGEADVDVAVGEDEVLQSMPDVIAQLIDTTLPAEVAYESAPYFNTPLLKRIDICIPCSVIRRPPKGCQGALIYRLGNIYTKIPATTLDSEGRVTTADPDAPQARCAAWFNRIWTFACFGEKSPVTQYTIRHRRKVGMGWSSWEFFQEPLRVFKFSIMDKEQIGPFDRNLDVDGGGSLVAAKAYDNVAFNSDFATSDWDLKAQISSDGGSPPYAPVPGTVQFRIQGYDAAGMQVAGTTDTVTLFIDNTDPNLEIASVNMGAQTGGICALFTQTGEPVPARLTVTFKAIQNQGFLKNYRLWVRKGNIITEFPIAATTGPMGEASGAIRRDYVHAGPDPCNELTGTRPPDEPLADASDFVSAFIVPVSPATNWLESGQTFCTFAINLEAVVRRTNGYTWAEYGFGNIGKAQYLLGIQQ